MTITLPEDDKRWLDVFSRLRRVSRSRVVREALRHYRRGAHTDAARSFKMVLADTAGAWKPSPVDAVDLIRAMRREWARRA